MKFILQPWHLAFVLVSAWVNQRQQQIIEFQNAEIEALLKKLGKDGFLIGKRYLLMDREPKFGSHRSENFGLSKNFRGV